MMKFEMLYEELMDSILNEATYAGSTKKPKTYLVRPPDMSWVKKVSEFVATPDGGYIKANKKYADSFNDFWKKHEEGHWEYFNRKVLPSIDKPVTQKKIDDAMDAIRISYPDNDEEAYAFKTQIDYLRKSKWTDKQIMEKFQKEYDKDAGNFDMISHILKRYVEA